MHAIEADCWRSRFRPYSTHGIGCQTAHAIAAARPYTPQATVSPTDLFSYKSTEIVKKYKMKNLFFTPLHETRIINAELKYLVTADEFCTITPEGERDATARFRSDVPVMGRKISIGMKIGNNVTTLNDLPLYIDIPLVADKSSYLKLTAVLPLHDCRYSCRN